MPVAPSRTWWRRPRARPSSRRSIACGWSPVGSNGATSSKSGMACSLADGPPWNRTGVLSRRGRCGGGTRSARSGDLLGGAGRTKGPWRGTGGRAMLAEGPDRGVRHAAHEERPDLMRIAALRRTAADRAGPAHARRCAPTRARGQSLVEFALVLLPLFLLILGVVQFGLIFNSYVTMTNAAREGARTGTDLRLRPNAHEGAERHGPQRRDPDVGAGVHEPARQDEPAVRRWLHLDRERDDLHQRRHDDHLRGSRRA